MRTGTRYALVLAGAYVAFAGIYIVASGAVAAQLAGSVDELERIERLKGVLYVFVTGSCVFLGARVMARRLEAASDELLRRERALLVNDRRVSVGLMAASIAHDANNSLFVVLTELSMLQDDIPPHFQERIAPIHQALKKLVALNQRLLAAARTEVGGPGGIIDATATLRESVALLRSHRSLMHGQLTFESEGTLSLAVRPVLLHQIVTNLVVNAGEATGGHGRVDVRLRTQGDDLVLEVHDDGPGVPPERRAGLFDALMTTKQEGSGLGLFSVKACARSMGGTVEVSDSPLGGACFRVRVPLLQATKEA